MIIGLLALSSCFGIAYILVAAMIAPAAKEDRRFMGAVVFGLCWPYMVYLQLKNRQ
jgi:hypothetical protein